MGDFEELEALLAVAFPIQGRQLVEEHRQGAGEAAVGQPACCCLLHPSTVSKKLIRVSGIPLGTLPSLGMTVDSWQCSVCKNCRNYLDARRKSLRGPCHGSLAGWGATPEE